MSTHLEPLKRAVGFTPFGDVVGNLTLGRGKFGDTAVQVALVENKIASGSLGIMECNKLAQLFRLAAKDTKPLILYLDSAGARVSQGLPALGAFRAMFRAAMELASSPAQVITVLGTNCYGGASMLAHLGRARIFAPQTQLAMSGPSILAQAAGSNPLDEMFKAIAQASISAEARSKVSAANIHANSLDAHLARAFAVPAVPAAQRHLELGERLGKLRDGLKPPVDPVQRKDLTKLFAEGHELRERDGLVVGEATLDGARHRVMGFIGGKPMGAAAAWALADLAWKAVNGTQGDAPALLLLDADSHSARVEDEKIILSEYLFNLSLALHRLAPARLAVLGTSGGGSFVAFSASTQRLGLVHGKTIQVLPGSAIASILGENNDDQVDFAELKKAGVAEEELRLGLLPGVVA
ncbi:MAG: biotin-independent malonate decarboxylase subunit gamma [Burkholderiales bacterium]|nr:biotin-independent malonate decarboxylase subunit gamma [Burkholderiales bacterium]